MTRDADAYEQMVKDANRQRPPITPAGDKAEGFPDYRQRYQDERAKTVALTAEVEQLREAENRHSTRSKERLVTIATLTRRLALAEALADAVWQQIKYECDFPHMDRCGDFTIPCDERQVQICLALKAFREGEK